MQLDGSYCCATCGKVSGILGCWKKQLLIAKDARSMDVLRHRIWLSYRLLYGTSRFKELHEIIRDAKAKLETEVGPVNGVSARMARGIVSELSIAEEDTAAKQSEVSLRMDEVEGDQTQLLSLEREEGSSQSPYKDLTSLELLAVKLNVDIKCPSKEASISNLVKLTMGLFHDLCSL